MANCSPDVQSSIAESAIETIKALPGNHAKLDEAELSLIETALMNGETWDTLAAALGKESGLVMHEHYALLGGQRLIVAVHSGLTLFTEEFVSRANPGAAEFEARVTDCWKKSGPLA